MKMRGQNIDLGKNYNSKIHINPDNRNKPFVVFLFSLFNQHLKL